MRGLGDVTRRVGKPPVWSGNRCSEVGLLCGINEPPFSAHQRARTTTIRNRPPQLFVQILFEIEPLKF
jgi:hypothetical protein